MASKEDHITYSSENNETKAPDLEPNTDQQQEEDNEEYARYCELYKAATVGDWTKTRGLLDQHPDLFTAPLSYWKSTLLHVAVASSRRNTTRTTSFVEELVELMIQKGIPLGLKDGSGYTPLHYAAKAANNEATRLLVDKDPTLIHLLSNSGVTPLQIAAGFGHEEIVRYLLLVTVRLQPSLLTGASGADFVMTLTMDGFYDIAIQVLEDNPRLAVEHIANGNTILGVLANQPQAFPSGMKLTFWQRLLYHVWKRMLASNRSNSGHKRDIENSTTEIVEYDCKILLSWVNIFHRFHRETTTHRHALTLLKSLTEKAAKTKEAADVIAPAARTAALNGIHEFVAQVIRIYPQTVDITNVDGRNLFDLAVIYRQEKVFNLIYQLGSWRHFAMNIDGQRRTLLHHAAQLDSSSKIEKIPGAALQMQRELQWYKEVEKVGWPSNKVSYNKDGKTPATVFAESHKELVNEGERWMKDTANSYTIVAALVVTIAFAAALTIPGGNNGDSGLPILLYEPALMVFALSNALALFSSTASLLMFLGILTSRYAQDDFLEALTKRLAIGLITLFFSIASMLVAFTASTHLTLSHRVPWIVIPIGLLACLPLLLFAFLQFPLLVEVVYSTFGPSIFGKQSDELLI